MEKKTRSLKFLKQRKFMMVLPALVLPFLTMMFWALGGGKGSEASAQKNKGGLNLELPGAAFNDDKSLSKLSFYEQAERDSAKYKELMKNDPYYQQEEPQTREVAGIPAYDPLPPHSSSRHSTHYKDANEEKVYRKLAQLNEQLNKSTPAEKVQKDLYARNSKPSNLRTMKSEDIDRLENMMQMMKNGNNTEDPEMKQLNALLEKVLDVQHPDRVKQRITNVKAAKQDETVPVTLNKDQTNMSLLGSSNNIKKDRLQKDENNIHFFGLDDSSTSIKKNAIVAIVHENQVLVSGAVVKLRLSQDINLQGQIIPKGQFVFGIAELNDERLNISINSLRYANALYNVKLEVYDLDGMSGIYIPGATSRDVVKQAADNALQSAELMTMDRSLPAQAAAAGVNAAKSLLNKKIKQVKVTVKAGYQVLLKDRQEKQ